MNNWSSGTNIFQLEDIVQVTPYSLNGIFPDIENSHSFANFEEHRTCDLFRPQVVLKNVNYCVIETAREYLLRKRFGIIFIIS